MGKLAENDKMLVKYLSYFLSLRKIRLKSEFSKDEKVLIRNKLFS